MIEKNSPTALAIKQWAEKALGDCQALLLKEDTTWDKVVGLRREIKRLRDLQRLLTENPEE